MLASMIAPHPVGSEAPSSPAGAELPAGIHPDYLFALVATPQIQGSASVGVVPGDMPSVAVVEAGPPKPVAVVRSSQWTMGIRRATQHPLVRLVYGLSSAGAMGVSYSENKSIPWALLHGFIGPAYLAYVGWNRYTGKGNRNQGSPAWWGGDAHASAAGSVRLDPFEADSQEAAWEEGQEIAGALPYSDFDPVFRESFVYSDGDNPEIIDIWPEDEPEGSGFRW